MKWIRNWIKNIFSLCDVEDLTIGGHCGCCGAWVEKVIVPKDWAITVCDKCVQVVKDSGVKKIYIREDGYYASGN